MRMHVGNNGAVRTGSIPQAWHPKGGKPADEYYRLVAEAARDIVFIADPEGVLHYVNGFAAVTSSSSWRWERLRVAPTSWSGG